ncbi:glycoside hydrolase family 2 TIM barrel-domain containing protein [Pontibacter harenae]|uniref:glycoside hydrolase family 2 TIM barrel-domain containing protein n=1 Tax=Pontibacter harenae TaxID=2894083 RepID=UPI001E413185|nr:glycoside hydrolase family 2 TIM barrel-domain containing protein [Pontibacter harenae]MCC9165807.1 glycoside hydrolase family 2 [Pontibacter harenae]
MFIKRLLSILFILLSVAEAYAKGPDTRQVKYLSGTDNENTVPWDFYVTGGRKSGYWTQIPVPSHWEQEGFGTYNYGRDYVTYGKNFRFADEKGMYKHTFEVPKNWKGRDVFIVFEGSMTDTEVKVNGKPAGPIHQGAFYEFKYNISDKLEYGKENVLEVTVSKMSASPSVNNAERLADYWIFGGIFRPVYLESFPKEHIAYTAIDAKADGAFSMNVHLRNSGEKHEVAARILDANGKVVGTAAASFSPGDTVVNIKTKVNNPLQWTAETPNLYTVQTSIKSGRKEIFQATDKFGFRTIEIREGDGIYLNGTKIKMKGVNRHVWWPETGRAVSAAIDLMDVKLMKEMNMNAVRCSHYPPNKSFLQICDSLGLYVLDELAGWQNAYSTEAGEPLVKEMVIRDVNHPSVIFWSNGNEGGHNFELDDDYGKYDHSKRPVIHAHHRPGNVFNGIDCNHYEDYYSTKKILEGPNIYMPTEFLHAQDDGGGGTSLADFWELHWNSKLGAGGFLWDLTDEGIVRTDQNGIIDVNRVNAPDGLMGPHREKEGSFFAIKEIYSPVHIKLEELPVNFNGEIPVENRYHFTNLNQCMFQWELADYRKPGDVFAGYITRKKGTGAGPSIAPVAKGNLKLNLPSDWKVYDMLLLSAYDSHKELLYTWTWNVKCNETLLEDIVILTREQAAAVAKADTTAQKQKNKNGADWKVEVTETESSITLKGGEIAVTLSKKDGTIVGLANDKSKSLTFGNGPVMVAGNAAVASVKNYEEGDGHVVEVNYSGDMKYAKWKMHGSGWLSLEYEYSLNGNYPFTGISFTYPENFMISAKWLGRGPYRVWKNRQQGVALNVWENAYNDTHTGSAPWIYPEFKGYFADVTWMEFSTAEGKFLVASKEDDLFVRRLDFYGLSGVKPHPSLPVGNISFLDNIPPLGTKLALNISANTKNLGPAGEMNKVSGPVKRTLYFYFGLPETGDTSPQQFNRPVKDELF